MHPLQSTGAEDLSFFRTFRKFDQTGLSLISRLRRDQCIMNQQISTSLMKILVVGTEHEGDPK